MTAPNVTDAHFAHLTLQLTQLGLTAPDLSSAMHPALHAITLHTAARAATCYACHGNGATIQAHSGAAPGALPLAPELLGALSGTPDLLVVPDARGTAGQPGGTLLASPIRDRAGQLTGALVARTFTPHRWTASEQALVRTSSGMLALLGARLSAEQRERDAHESALRALGLCMETRSDDLQGHADRVTDLALHLGRAMNLSPAELDALRWGASLHDIGKLALPDEILHHPGPLTPAMRQRMHQHVEEGLRLARQLPFVPRAALDVIASHHERWDGTGYPCGQRGTAIPLTARIFAACDVFDALTSARCYKPAWTDEEALNLVQRGSGAHFDPWVVQVLTQVLRRHSA
ncbi:HD-GYP domain-containing protein [Deinococcus taeanensis]|uniref:HD-GYP domain-containing protein n=1 Tax=Deinococcus taeanensis TaxID=2737050 RepID=UPI001CDB4B61|nr:HD-GYP domain-containing protein [Deinococcus taeanensis]UBV42853.1 HD-GYP domain-containing protein [Deinococcus taeanensis]